MLIRKYGGVSKGFRTGRLDRELQMVQLSATRCSCLAILWVSLVSFAAINLCVSSERVIPKISVFFDTTESGNFWIHPRKENYRLVKHRGNFTFTFICSHNLQNSKGILRWSSDWNEVEVTLGLRFLRQWRFKSTSSELWRFVVLW
jgi:hypothetical protein